MLTASGKKSMFHRAGLALISLFLLYGVIAGCQPRTVTATINYGPFGPAELQPDKVKVLMDYMSTLSPASSMNIYTEEWPLEIKFSPGAKFSVVAIHPKIIIADGKPWGTSSTLPFLVDELRQDLLAGFSVREAIEKCDLTRLTSKDEPRLELSLDTEQRGTIGSLIQEFSMKDPDSGYGGAPYPGYVLILDWNGVPVSVEWTGREYITLWTKGVYGGLTWYDPGGELWQECLALLPPPLPDERRGLTKLFASTKEVRASGGNLGQPIVCGAWKVPILTRLLQKGQASSENAPTGEPVTVVFASDDSEWKVYLYENGFLFEEQYYRFDGIAKTFFTTMNAG